MRVSPAIELTTEQQRQLTRLMRSKRSSVRLAQRTLARALCASGSVQGIERDLPRGAPPVKVD